MARIEESDTSPLLGPETEDYHTTYSYGNGKSPATVEERGQAADEREEISYQGLPEVKKRLIYILPAVAIGVRLLSMFRNPPVVAHLARSF